MDVKSKSVLFRSNFQIGAAWRDRCVLICEVRRLRALVSFLASGNRGALVDEYDEQEIAEIVVGNFP